VIVAGDAAYLHDRRVVTSRPSESRPLRFILLLQAKTLTLDDSASLRALAAKCRRLARGCGTGDVGVALQEMADSYDRQARAAENGKPARARRAPGAGGT
jgi:hypothetical protein